MKKKILAVLFTAILTASLTACGSKDTSELKYLKDFKAENYVTLGEYKEITSELTEPEVTEEYLDGYVEYVMSSNAVSVPVTDRAAQLGDVANIDYEGKQDGVAFEGGTAQGTNLTLGSGQFIEGFEEGVVGMEIGETKDLNLTFPDPYTNNPDLSGAEVVFTVTLNSLTEQQVPELTDEYVASLESEEYKTAEEFKNYLRESLTEQVMADFENQKIDAALTAVEAGATFEEAPEGMVNRMNETLTANLTSYAEAYGMGMADYVAYAYGWTAEDYEANILEQSKMMAQRYIMLGAIADKEGITVTDEEFDEKIAEEAGLYGLTVEEYTEGMDLESYKEYLLTQEVLEYLGGNVIINSETVQE